MVTKEKLKDYASKLMFDMDDDNPKHTVLAGETYNAPTFFKETVTEFYDFGLESGVENQDTLNALNRLIVFIRDSSDSEFREKISEYLNIGMPNAKTFLKRLNLIQISLEELKELCQKLEM